MASRLLLLRRRARRLLQLLRHRLQASKKRRIDDQDPPGSGSCDHVDVGSVDHITRVPDAVLGSIVSLLPTKEGARTQVLSRRWRPIWRSAPLNLALDCELKNQDSIPKILSEHTGPARRFSVRLFTDCSGDEIDGWLSSQSLDNLQELELTCMFWLGRRPLSLSAFRFSPTLLVAKFHGFHFPNSIAQLSLKFPCLEQLTLKKVIISEDVLQSLLSGCSALESLELKENRGIARLCISSQTLRSLGFFVDWWNGGTGIFLQELVIEDAPCLERLLPLNSTGSKVVIRIICAPKLEIFGMLLSEVIPEFQLGSSIIQEGVAVSLTTKMHTMRVLALSSTGPNLDAVVNFLKCFPCLEKLYVIFRLPSDDPGEYMNARKYDPLDPIECLELHLKKVVLKNYVGSKSSYVDFARFFVLNTKGLEEMKITLPYHRQHGWFAHQLSLLRVTSRASPDARIEMRCGTSDDFTHNRDTHDLSMDDPFDLPSSGCSTCEEKGLEDAIYQI
ncbi:hypothetical protein CFC21_003140 [Triticum aestivum]|uniref:Uncharacterized protein n=1 Tax=Triticum aestivum TaxID=4565 RepID=A0A3B5Y3A2_WHEAT|nr:putative F-box/FBD/LRR-repeat protein At5g44950 [Triticum aestivum]KAF6985249.1 hypothetical protein CFC21_003140 [Triticum aestivum]